MSDDTQIGMDFFFHLDNETFGQFRLASQEVLNAEGPTFGVAQSFYTRPLSEFEAAARAAQGPLDIISSLIKRLVQDDLGGFGDNVVTAWANFGQGVLFDERRNVEPIYGFWPIHSMDGWYEKEALEYGIGRASPPSEYYTFYAAVRAFSVLGDADSWLNFGRSIAVGSATQNVAKPILVVSPGSFRSAGATSLPPTPYPPDPNPPISPAIIQEFRDRYLAMDFTQLDEAFKTGDNGVLGGQGPPGGGGSKSESVGASSPHAG